MASSHLTAARCLGFSRLATALDRRSAPRRALLFLGAVLARRRRTVTAWIRAAGLSDQFRPCYPAVAAAGKKAETIAAYLVLRVAEPLLSGAGRLTLAIDDTPTKRYGPHVQGPACTTTRTRPGRLAVRLRFSGEAFNSPPGRNRGPPRPPPDRRTPRSRPPPAR
jgi:hypothetical protein